MLAEAQKALHSIRVQATAPAGEEGVRKVVGARLVTYPQARMDPGQWSAWWQSYFDTCADLPETALEAGMKAWVADPSSEWMPKPGKLRELAQQTPNRHVRAYDRIVTALRISRAEPEAPREKVGPEKVADMLAGYRATMAERKAAELARSSASRPTHGPTDETGVTEQMRESIARREGAA